MAEINWNFDIEKAPAGISDPYSQSEDKSSEYLLIWNGFHMGVAWCQIDDADGTRHWWGEDSTVVSPEPIAFASLKPALTEVIKISKGFHNGRMER